MEDSRKNTLLQMSSKRSKASTCGVKYEGEGRIGVSVPSTIQFQFNPMPTRIKQHSRSFG